MPKTKISEYSATNSSNTDIEGINIDEGCPPSSINNAIRELMVHLKEFQTGASGDAFTFAGGTLMSGTNTISGAAVISGNINSSGTANTFSGGVVHSGTNTFSSSVIISGNINSSGTTNTFSGGNILSGTNTFSGTNVFSSDVTLNAQKDLRFADSDSSNWVAFQSPATVASNVTWTLPSADGTSNQALVTNGSGTLSWATASASPGGSNTELQYNNSGAFGGISGVTSDGTRITASTTIGVGGATPSTSGSGITFPATASASSNANTLDDYEEGTWTASVGGDATYNDQTCYYTKIGRVVYVCGIISINNIGTGSASEVSGLPFTSSNGFSSGAVTYYGGITSSAQNNPIPALASGTTTTFGFSWNTSAATTTSQFRGNLFQNSSRVDFGFFYFAS